MTIRPSTQPHVPPTKNKKPGRAVPNHAVHLRSIHRATETGENGENSLILSQCQETFSLNTALLHRWDTWNTGVMPKWFSCDRLEFQKPPRTLLDALFSLMSGKRHFHHLIEKSLENHHLNSTDSGDLHWGKNKALVSTTSSASFICVGQVDHGIWMHMVYGSVIEYTNHRLVGQHTQAPAPILFSSPASHDSRAKLVWRPSQYFAATAWGNRQLNMKFDMI